MQDIACTCLRNALLLQISMSLSVLVCVCLLFMVSCRAAPSWAFTQTGQAPSSALNGDVQQGLVAEKYLLDGAEFMYSPSDNLVLYKRRGGIKTAISDFGKLSPTNIKFRKGVDKAYLRGGGGWPKCRSIIRAWFVSAAYNYQVPGRKWTVFSPLFSVLVYGVWSYKSRVSFAIHIHVIVNKRASRELASTFKSKTKRWHCILKLCFKIFSRVLLIVIKIQCLSYM